MLLLTLEPLLAPPAPAPDPPLVLVPALVLPDPMDECRLVGVCGAEGGCGEEEEALPALPFEPEPETTRGRLYGVLRLGAVLRVDRERPKRSQLPEPCTADEEEATVADAGAEATKLCV